MIDISKNLIIQLTFFGVFNIDIQDSNPYLPDYRIIIKKQKKERYNLERLQLF